MVSGGFPRRDERDLPNAGQVDSRLSTVTYNSAVNATEGPTLPRIFGRYILLKSLGQGAMGDVHLARPINPGRGIPRLAVLKRLRGELVTKEAFVARFRHEATVAVSVNSRHVAKVYDVGSVGRALYIAMEYVSGWALSDVLDAILRSGRHASIVSVLDLMAGGLRGLVALHSAQERTSGRPLAAVHRDVSPKNLMVGEDGNLRLIDLGLGKSNLQDWKTRTGVVMGSVGYMPPEQARGERVDQRADIYAMGAVTFELLALRNYIRRGTVSEMMQRSLKPKYVPPSEFRPDIPPGLDEVLQVALAPAPADRFPTAQAFLQALEAVVSNEQTRGGMKTLLDELFGDGRRDRQRELERLLALPDPILDTFDTQPTRVFALGPGVRPDEGEQIKTAATELSPGPPPDSDGVNVRPVWPDPASMMPTEPAPRTVSPSVLIAAVFAAAFLGGALAVGLQAAIESPSQMDAADAPTASSPPLVAPPATARAVAQPAASSPPEPPPLQPVELEPTKRSAAAVGRAIPAVDRRPPAEFPPPRRRVVRRSAPATTIDDLDAELDMLARTVDGLRTVADRDRRRDLTALLIAIRQARVSQDAERKASSLERLRGDLRDLIR